VSETLLTAKQKFGMFAIGIVAGLQVVAWFCGHDGSVFALTSAIIGGVTGSVLGFEIAKTKK